MTVDAIVAALKAELERQAETYLASFVDFDPLLPSTVADEARGFVRIGGIFDLTALAQAVQPQWHDMSVAPKDGTGIIAYSRWYAKFVVVRWLNDVWHGDSIIYGDAHFTHWQLLPSPPQAVQKAVKP